MIDVLFIKFSESFNPDKTIKIKLRDYMKTCNLDSLRGVREQLKTDLEIFYKCSVQRIHLSLIFYLTKVMY